MRTLIVNTKLGFHSGATSLTHTATVECRQEFLNKELFTQTFSLDCSCFRFLADVRTGDIRLYLKTFQPKYGSRETMRNAFDVEHLSGGGRRVGGGGALGGPYSLFMMVICLVNTRDT